MRLVSSTGPTYLWCTACTPEACVTACVTWLGMTTVASYLYFSLSLYISSSGARCPECAYIPSTTMKRLFKGFLHGTEGSTTEQQAGTVID